MIMAIQQPEPSRRPMAQCSLGLTLEWHTSHAAETEEVHTVYPFSRRRAGRCPPSPAVLLQPACGRDVEATKANSGFRIARPRRSTPSGAGFVPKGAASRRWWLLCGMGWSLSDEIAAAPDLGRHRKWLSARLRPANWWMDLASDPAPRTVRPHRWPSLVRDHSAPAASPAWSQCHDGVPASGWCKRFQDALWLQAAVSRTLPDVRLPSEGSRMIWRERPDLAFRIEVLGDAPSRHAAPTRDQPAGAAPRSLVLVVTFWAPRPDLRCTSALAGRHPEVGDGHFDRRVKGPVRGHSANGFPKVSPRSG